MMMRHDVSADLTKKVLIVPVSVVTEPLDPICLPGMLFVNSVLSFVDLSRRLKTTEH